jgi:hypothetical protein
VTKVFKYPLAIASDQTLALPSGAKVLHVNTQGTDEVFLWAEIAEGQRPAPLHIEMFGTGDNMPYGNRQYIGTVILPRSLEVYHFYLKGDIKPGVKRAIV